MADKMFQNLKHFKRGELCKDGKVFWGYQPNKTEYWVSVEKFNFLKNKKTQNDKIWKNKNPEKLKNWSKNWYRRNSALVSLRRKQKYIKNPCYKIASLLSTDLYKTLKKRKKSKKSKTIDAIGCSKEFLIYYIEQRMQDGMTWENYGKWHIDHIYPKSLAKTEDEVYKLYHYTNLRPMWASENIRKSNKTDYQLNLN